MFTYRSDPTSRGAHEAFLAWLYELDGDKGTMLCYLAPLQREFSTLEEMAAAFVPEPTGNNILDNVDPALFDSLGVTMLGSILLSSRLPTHEARPQIR